MNDMRSLTSSKETKFTVKKIPERKTLVQVASMSYQTSKKETLAIVPCSPRKLSKGAHNATQCIKIVFPQHRQAPRV